MKRKEKMSSSPKNKAKGMSFHKQDPFVYEQQFDESIDPYLPKVLIMLSDNVQLIRFNSVPLLHAQIEILQNPKDYDSELQKLGLNDVIYLVPEFTPSQYELYYPDMWNGNEFEDFRGFFEHFSLFDIVKKKDENDHYGIPKIMKYLYKNCMTAINQDYYDPNFRGKAKINLKHIPNGHYTVYFLRIGQPIRVSSRLKVLGKLSSVFINLNRDKLSRDKKPTMELFGSGRLARYDAINKF